LNNLANGAEDTTSDKLRDALLKLGEQVHRLHEENKVIANFLVESIPVVEGLRKEVVVLLERIGQELNSEERAGE
jgi:hypothetical protein